MNGKVVVIDTEIIVMISVLVDHEIECYGEYIIDELFKICSAFSS